MDASPLAGLAAAAQLNAPLPAFANALGGALDVPPGVPKFLSCLWDILGRPELAGSIRWNAAGDALEVVDVDALERDVLPRWFKHSKYASFLKQLSMYAFRKQPAPARTWAHPWFRRGRPQDLVHVERKSVGRPSGAGDAAGGAGETPGGSAFDGDGGAGVGGDDHGDAGGDTAAVRGGGRGSAAASAGPVARRGAKRRRAASGDGSGDASVDEYGALHDGPGSDLRAPRSATVDYDGSGELEVEAPPLAGGHARRGVAAWVAGRRSIGAPAPPEPPRAPTGTGLPPAGGDGADLPGARRRPPREPAPEQQLQAALNAATEANARAQAAFAVADGLALFAERLLELVARLVDAGGMQVQAMPQSAAALDAAAARSTRARRSSAAPVVMRIAPAAAAAAPMPPGDAPQQPDTAALVAALRASGEGAVRAAAASAGLGAGAQPLVPYPHFVEGALGAGAVPRETGVVVATAPPVAEPPPPSESLPAAVRLHLAALFPAAAAALTLGGAARVVGPAAAGAEGDPQGTSLLGAAPSAPPFAAGAAAGPVAAGPLAHPPRALLPGLQRQGWGAATAGGGPGGAPVGAPAPLQGQPPDEPPTLIPMLMTFPQSSFGPGPSPSAGGGGAAREAPLDAGLPSLPPSLSSAALGHTASYMPLGGRGALGLGGLAGSTGVTPTSAGGLGGGLAPAAALAAGEALAGAPPSRGDGGGGGGGSGGGGGNHLPLRIPLHSPTSTSGGVGLDTPVLSLAGTPVASAGVARAGSGATGVGGDDTDTPGARERGEGGDPFAHTSARLLALAPGLRTQHTFGGGGGGGSASGGGGGGGGALVSPFLGPTVPSAPPPPPREEHA